MSLSSSEKFERQLLYLFFAAAIAYFSWKMIELTIPYFSFETDVDFLLVKQNLLANRLWMWAFYLHIGFSPVVLLTGIVQFYAPWQQRLPKVHRISGYFYVLTVLVISAPTGLIMGFYANGGWPAKISFITISLLWWFWTFRAIQNIRIRKIIPHQHDMWRSYALTLSAITLRLYVLILPLFFNLRGSSMYVLVSWLSWIPNIMLVEWLIGRKKP